MTHPLIENHADYFAVIARTDNDQPKDERFIARAFASSGFADEDAGDEGVPCTHEETKLTLACDGDTVVLHHPSNGNYAPMPLMYGDLFLALQRMQWSSAVLHCAGDAEEVIREMAARIPASYSEFTITVAMPEASSADVAELRASIAAASPVQHDEPGFTIGSLSEEQPPVDESSEERWGRIVDGEQPSDTLAHELPVATEAAPVTLVQPIPAPAPARAPTPTPAGPTPTSARVAQTEPRAVQDHDSDDRLPPDYARLLSAREREIDSLHEIIKQMLLGQSMNQFAAATLPHDAILIAHLYAPSTSKLEVLGFERVYNLYTNEEYGVTVDGAFLVFTKDVAGPDWMETLLSRLGGRIERVWQAAPSAVGNLLAQRVHGSSAPADRRAADAERTVTQLDEAIGAAVQDAVAAAPKEYVGGVRSATNPDSPAEHQHESSVSQPFDQAASQDDLTPEQQKAIDAMGSTFTTIMREVFKVSNDTQAVAGRVSKLETIR